MRERGGWRGREDEGVEGVLGYYEHLQVDLVDAAKKGIGDEGLSLQPPTPVVDSCGMISSTVIEYNMGGWVGTTYVERQTSLSSKIKPDLKYFRTKLSSRGIS